WRQGELIAVFAVAWVSDVHRATADEMRLVETTADRLTGSVGRVDRRRDPPPFLEPTLLRTMSEGRGVFDTIALATAALVAGRLAVVWVIDPRDRSLWPEGWYAADTDLEPVLAALSAIPDGEDRIGTALKAGSLQSIADI